MVFMNMGGPSTTDEVGDFLSRLFVRAPTQEAQSTLDVNS
jgi:protoheme ferro-lyase